MYSKHCAQSAVYTEEYTGCDGALLVYEHEHKAYHHAEGAEIGEDVTKKVVFHKCIY
jgi:hypothetical protein